MTPQLHGQKIVFFDGVCGLCNGFVDFVMKYDSRQNFMFSPLQSDFAKANLPPEYVNDLRTMIVQIDGKTFKKSHAVFSVLKDLGLPWSILSLLQIFPNSILNFGYDFVATNRYRLFGKKASCRLPTPEQRQRFIL